MELQICSHKFVYTLLLIVSEIMSTMSTIRWKTSDRVQWLHNCCVCHFSIFTKALLHNGLQTLKTMSIFAFHDKKGFVGRNQKCLSTLHCPHSCNDCFTFCYSPSIFLQELYSLSHPYFSFRIRCFADVKNFRLTQLPEKIANYSSSKYNVLLKNDFSLSILAFFHWTDAPVTCLHFAIQLPKGLTYAIGPLPDVLPFTNFSVR